MPEPPEDADLLRSILQEEPRPRNTPGIVHPDMADAQDVWNALREPVPPFKDILWAYDHLEADSPSPLHCPTRGAWALLEFGRGNPKDFLTRLLPQATTELERRRQERLAEEREKAAEEKLRQKAEEEAIRPPLPESEAKAIEEIRKLISLAMEDASSGGV